VAVILNIFPEASGLNKVLFISRGTAMFCSIISQTAIPIRSQLSRQEEQIPDRCNAFVPHFEARAGCNQSVTISFLGGKIVKEVPFI
jgi:hypothetical protein